MRKIREEKIILVWSPRVGLGRGDMRLLGGPAPLPPGDFRLRHGFIHRSIFLRVNGGSNYALVTMNYLKVE